MVAVCKHGSGKMLARCMSISVSLSDKNTSQGFKVSAFLIDQSLIAYQGFECFGAGC